MVSQSFSTRQTICLQRRRVPDLKLCPDAWHDDLWPHRRTVASARTHQFGKSSAARQGGIDLPRSGSGSSFLGNLSDCKTNLDAELDHLQRRLVLSSAGG